MGKYRIPASIARVDLDVLKSRFIATLSYADSVQAARGFIAAVRAEMPDASHHVYAFKVGYGSSVTEGLSDDGEPTGTAGPPIMAVLRGADIGDAALVVTRYFGGTKLGTGGLVKAYGDAAKAALAALHTRDKIDVSRVGLSVPYALYERVRLLAAAHQAIIDDESFEADITLFLTLPVDALRPFADAIRDLSAGRLEPVALD